MSDHQYYGVIDIGSNSVRMVIYSGLRRVPEVIFNEKTLCGLGRAVGHSGKMDTDSIDMALMTLRRYKALCNQMDIRKVDVVATAAVRDAANGQDFVERVKAESGFSIQIISGEEEGRLSGLGVLAGEPHARGVMGDLGGGSLELVRLLEGRVEEKISLPIGPLNLASRFGDDFSAMKGHVRSELQKISWLHKTQDETLYIVGGAWRNLAKLMMREQFTPLPVVHGFRTRRDDLLSYSKRVSNLRPQDIPYASMLNGRRRAVLPVAAMLLSETMQATAVAHAITSSHGLRDGLVYEKLDAETRAKDPFLQQCRLLANERSRFPEHADLLYEWTRPLFDNVNGRISVDDHRSAGECRKQLHMATCLLSDIAWRGHPDFRAEKAVETILHGQFVGVSHVGRAFVAVALNQAYGGTIEAPLVEHVLPLLSAQLLMEARILGSSLRLAQRLSGGTVSALETSLLKSEKKKISLSVFESSKDIMNEVVEKRLKQLGQLTGKAIQVEIKENH